LSYNQLVLSEFPIRYIPKVHISPQIHLHGHDFVLLDSGTGTFDLTTFSSLNFTNPPRRDVAVMPASGGFGIAAGGYIVIGFPLDNPGIWAFVSKIWLI
jgi:hypothetical protein